MACTYCDLAGIDEETMKNLNQGFAVGIGVSMEATCGAIIGAVNVLGAINKNPQKTMKSARNVINSFKEQNGTVICKELKGIADGVVKRECIDCVRDAARLLEMNWVSEPQDMEMIFCTFLTNDCAYKEYRVWNLLQER